MYTFMVLSTGVKYVKMAYKNKWPFQNLCKSGLNKMASKVYDSKKIITIQL